MPVIKKNVKVPDKVTGNEVWKSMKIGDCAIFEEHKDNMAMRDKLQVYAHVYGRSVQRKFKTRTIDGILHVWRTA